MNLLFSDKVNQYFLGETIMELVSMKEMLNKALQEGYAVGQF